LLADHGDRVTYAHSVEARYPFLDLAVIDWVRRTSPQWLVYEYVEKYPLRQVASRYLPAAIARREKFGFVAPSCAVLLQKRVEWVEDLLSYDSIKRGGYFNPDTVERLKTQYRQENFDINTTFDVDLLMIVLTFEIFRDSFSIPCL
jgi:asparagine synthase (glutamine-hydrolysing)